MAWFPLLGFQISYAFRGFSLLMTGFEFAKPADQHPCAVLDAMSLFKLVIFSPFRSALLTMSLHWSTDKLLLRGLNILKMKAGRGRRAYHSLLMMVIGMLLLYSMLLVKNRMLV